MSTPIPPGDAGDAPVVDLARKRSEKLGANPDYDHDHDHRICGELGDRIEALSPEKGTPHYYAARLCAKALVAEAAAALVEAGECSLEKAAGIIATEAFDALHRAANPGEPEEEDPA